MTSPTYRAPDGEFPVGVRDGEVTDTAYPTMREEDASGRRLMVRVWYPAAVSDVEPRPYLIEDEIEILRWFLEVGGAPPEWAGQLAAVRTHSRPDAPIAAGRFPTLLFSHGATGWVCQNTPLMEHLASHGYVVWSVAHPGEASGVRYADGSVVRYDDAFQDTIIGLDYGDKFTGDVGQRHVATPTLLDDLGLGPWCRRWVDDHRAVTDAIEQDSVGGAAGALVASCDLGALGIVGMSFGGAAAASTPEVDDRFRAAVNLDGAQFLSDLLEVQVRVPLLHVSTDFAAAMAAVGRPVAMLDANEFFFEPLERAGLSDGVHRLRIADATHPELTDLALLPEEERGRLAVCAGVAESQRTLDLLNAAVSDFLDQELRGQDRGFPTRLLAESPELSTVDLTPIREWATNEAKEPA